VVAEIFAAYLEPRASLFGVSRHLREMGVPAPRGGKAWSTATLRGILTNSLYAGKVYAGGACATAPPGSDARPPTP
jgi:site-specific DNA recombinase